MEKHSLQCINEVATSAKSLPKWFLQGRKRRKITPWKGEKKKKNPLKKSAHVKVIHDSSHTDIMINPLRTNQGVDFICSRWTCHYLEVFIYQYLTLAAIFLIAAIFNRDVQRSFFSICIHWNVFDEWLISLSRQNNYLW